MKLMTTPGHTSTAAHIVLEWSGLPFVAQIMDRHALGSPEIRGVNPQGLTPWLVDGDLHLGQTLAIMQYVDAKAPEARLLGDGSARQRAVSIQWLAFLNSDVHAAMAPMFAPHLFLGPEYSGDVLRPKAEIRSLHLLRLLDDRLEGREWITGTRSCADAYIFMATRWADALGLDTSGLRNLRALALRLRENSGVRAVMRREGLW